MSPNYANLFMGNFEQNFCVIILKNYDLWYYHDLWYYDLWYDWYEHYDLRYDFILLTIFSSYGPVTRTLWIISFPSHRTTVNPRT